MMTLMERDSKSPEPGMGEGSPSRLSTNEALALFVHELRSPLGALQNALHVLRLVGGADRNLQQAVGVMERQAGYMGQLIGDLLDLTSVTAGKLELHEEWIDLAMAMAQAVEVCRPLIEQNHHRVTASVPPEPICLRADRTRLQQILVNLLSNAAKYTERGGHIELTAEAAGDVVLVRVRDNGMGIAPELMPQIFDLFRQGPRLGNRGQGGLGVGLALVKWLVELHGGSIEAFSDGPGTGTDFVVRLPAFVNLAFKNVAHFLAPPDRTLQNRLEDTALPV